MEGVKTVETEGYLPVLVLTAQPAHKLRALQAGARDFVSKPFDPGGPAMRCSVHNCTDIHQRVLHAVWTQTCHADRPRRVNEAAYSEHDRSLLMAVKRPGRFARFEFPTIGRVYGSNRQPLIELARESRQIAQYGDIPPIVRDAILATEDKHVEGDALPALVAALAPNVLAAGAH